MPQGKGQRAVKMAEPQEDELSLDDLDRVVGGLNSEQQNSEGPAHEGGDGGYVPPTVHAPAHLPDQINQVEQQVVNHTITGDQAVSQIAGIIGAQPDHSQQNIAGAEIASLIGRGIIDANTAMSDLHNAVTQNHSLTGDQAAGILAGVVFAQYNTAGEDTSIATAATTELTNLINAGATTADHAVSAFAALAGQQLGYGITPLMGEINSLVQQYGLTPSQVGADVVATVDSNDLSGTQAITILAGLATSFPGANHPFVEVAGQEIAGLITQHNIDPTVAMNAVTSAEYMGSGGLSEAQIPALMFAVVEANPALADAAGAELGASVLNDPFYQFNGAFHSAVNSLGVSADDAMAVLLAASHRGATWFASEMIVELYINHTFTIAQEMTAILDNASSAGHADDAVTLLHGLVVSGYASTFMSPAETALVSMINNHQITATQAVNDLLPLVTISDSRGIEMLMAVGTAVAPDAASAVTAAVNGLVQAQAHDASSVVQALASLVGGSSSVADKPLIDAVVLQQISLLVSSGALTADAAVDALANVAATTLRWTGKEVLCTEIATIAANANPPLSATEVIADVMAHVQAGAESNTMLVLGFLAGHGHDLQAAAGAALVAMVDPNNYYVSNPSWVANDVTWWVSSGASTLSAESAIALLAAAVGNGTTVISPDVAGAAIATLVTSGHIPPAQITADIHAAVVSGLLSGDAALVLLANLAANAPTAQVAVNSEMLALVTGASPLVQPGHATEILTALHDAAVTAGNTAFAAILNSELAVLPASDPAIAVFNGLNTTTSDADIEIAAAQLAAGIASGASSVAAVMADIDQALARGTLTVPQAAELLVDIASHGNLAAQVAAGTEFAKIADSAGTSIFNLNGLVPTSQYEAIMACLAVGLGGSPSYPPYHVSTTMSAEAALAFVLGALGSSVITEPTRTNFETAMRTLFTGGGLSSLVYFPAPSYGVAGMGGAFVSAINDIAAAHAMPGPELIRAVFVLGDTNYVTASRELQTLIGNHSVSMTDVHTAITSGWWQIDNAVQVLAGISSTPAVMSELTGLIAGGTITVDHFVNDLHQGLVHAWSATPVAAADYARVMGVLASSSDAATRTAVVNELAHVINDGQLDSANLQAILSAAGSGQSALLDQVLLALGGNDLGQLVGLNLMTLDHALNVLLPSGELYGAVAHAVAAGTCDATLLMNGLTQLVANGTLSAGDANAMVMQMAETADGALAGMAGALLAAVVSSGGMSAQAAMSELISDANKYAHTQFGAPGINVPQMTNVLNGFIAHCDPASSYAAAQAATTLANVGYSFFPFPSSALPFVIAAAHNANADSLYRIGGALEGMISRGETTIGAIASGISDLSGANALILYADITKFAAMAGAAQIIGDALAEITAMVPGKISPSAAVAGLNGLLSSSAPLVSTANYAVLSQAVADQINAIVAANPDAGTLSSIDDGIRAGTLTAAQAAQMLVDMIHGGIPSAGVAAEINSLIQQNLVSAFQIANAVITSGNAHAQSADAMVTALADLATVSPALGRAAGGQIESLILIGQIPGSQAMSDINALIDNPLTSDQAVGLFASMFSIYSTVIDVNGAVAENLVQLLNTNVISPTQLATGIAQAIANGGAIGDQAVLLYATIAKTHPELSDLATQGIIAQVNANVITASAVFNDINLTLWNTADHGINFAMNLAVNANAACVAAFGNFIGNLSIPDSAPALAGYMHASDAIAQIHNAYQQGISTPHAPGTLTAQQELTLLAGVLAAGSTPGPASSVLPPVHTELVALITSHAVTDTAVVAALEAVGASSALIQAVVNTEIAALETAIGPQMLIDVAAQTGADMAGVGHDLASMIYNYGQGSSVRIGDIMADISAANAAGNLSATQALAIITSLLGNATGTGAYAIIKYNPADSDWLASVAGTIEQLVQHGLSPDAAAAGIEGIAGMGPTLMATGDAVSLLASMAAYPDLQGAAATHIAGMMANSSLNLYGTQVAIDVANNVSTLSGHLHAADAVQLLALVAATNGSAAFYGQITQGMGDAQVRAQLTPDLVASTVEAMVASGALTAQQALHFLTPYGNVGPAPVGHAIGHLIANNQVSMADFAALIYGGALQDSGPIQNTNYWQQVAGSGDISFASAVLVLAAMTSQTPAAIAELTAIVSADTSSVWFVIESALKNAGQNPTTSGVTPQEAARALTVLVMDPAAAASLGGSFVSQLAGDIASLVGPSMTLGDAFGQVLSVGASGAQALSDGAIAIIGAMYGTVLGANPGVATGPDALFNAIGHGLTADQAVAILTGLSTTQTVDLQSVILQSHVRMDLFYIIATGALPGAQVMSDIHNACVADRIGAGSELALLAGIFEANNTSGSGNGSIGVLVADGINSLIGGGSLTLAQVMDGLAHGTYLPNTNIVTQTERYASYLAGGLTSNGAAALMALVAAGSSDPTAPSAAAGEIAAMIASNRMDQALAIIGINDMATSGALDPAKAVVLLASLPLNVSDSLHTAAGGEIAALVPSRITLDQAVATLVTMAHQGQAIQQIQAGAALGLLVAQNALDVATAVADIHAAVQSHTLTGDQAVAMLAGLNADAAPGVSTAVGNEIASLIAQGEPAANAMSLLLTAAANGSAPIQAGAGAVIGMLIAQHVVSAAQEIQGIDAAFNSGGLSAPAATNLLLNIAGIGDMAAQAAAGQEIGHIVQAANSTAGLAAQVTASNLSQDQAVVVLAAAIAGASTSALQTQIAALIQNLVDSGPIGVAQVMSDIDGAVGHGLTATQALTALAHLEEAGVGAMRTAILTETAALVTNHNVPATDAATALLAAAHGGSTALQSLIGGMLAALADHGLLTNQQVSDAISGASTLSNNEVLGVIVGMGVNGNAAAQAASGAGILMLVLNGRLDLTTVVSLIDSEARQGLVSAEHALQVVLNVMGAAIGDLDANPTSGHGAYDKYIRDQMSMEVVALTTSVAFHGGGAMGTLITSACGSVPLAEAVGLCLAAMWSADQTTPNPVVRNGTPLLPILADALANHQMTPDEALMLALASSAGGMAQTLLTGLVQVGAVTVDAAVHFLAVTAARTGDTDTANPFLAYGGNGGPDASLMTAAIRDLQALITGIPGVPPQASAATVMNDIAAAAVAHDLSGMQAVSLMANLVGRLGISDALAAANAIGTLVTQQQVDNYSAMQSIAWAIGPTSGLSQAQADLMYASMALSTDPAVQQIAFWAFNSLGGATLSEAMHAITSNSVFTHDQAFTIITTIASGMAALGSQIEASSALTGEIVSMVTSHQITADHAIAVLTGLAVTSGFQLNSLGVELNALIAANAISFGQAMNDLTHSALSVDQVMTVLTGLSAANVALDPLVLNQITTMIDSGALTAAQAMADIGNAPPEIALRLLTRCGNARADIEDAAAIEMAILVGQASSLGPLNTYNFYLYANANLDAVHAIGWIVSVAAHGNDALQSYLEREIQRGSATDVTERLTIFLANSTPTPLVQYYIGQLLGRLIDHPAVLDTPAQIAKNVIAQIDQTIQGTEIRNWLAAGPGVTAAMLPKVLPPDVAALVLLGATNATHNSDAHAAVDKDLKLVSGDIDAQLLVNIATVMAPQQALTQFVTMIQQGWASVALVATQIADMIAHGSLTEQQVVAAMAPLDTTHQLALVTDILAHGETNNAVLTSQFATLVLLTWGVAPTSQVYANMHDALMQVVPDFVGLARGTTTAAQAINDVRGIAAAHGVMADLLLLAVYQSTAVDSGAADFASSAAGALSQVGRELYSHITDGSTSLAVAQLVLNGSLPESVADTLLKDLAMSATIPPNQIMGSVANGDMSVWYADAHYPGWSSNAQELAFTVTQAVGMMHVDVHVAHDLAAVQNGTMSGAQAVADILAAAGGSEYAKDMGLMALVHGLEGTAAAAGAMPAIDAEIASRLMGGAAENALVGMAAHGWMSGQAAVDMFHSELAAATSGLDANATSFLECMALARLDMAASPQADPNATPWQQLMHGHATSASIENIIEATDAAKILTGLGALQLTIGDSYQLGVGIALSQHVVQVLAAQLQAQEAAHPGSTGINSSDASDWASGLPSDMKALAGAVQIASQYFTLGMAYAHTGIDAIKSGFSTGLTALENNFAPAGDIRDLSTNPANVQRWADLGVDLAVGGVPGAGIFNAMGAGLPVWAGGLQSYMLNEAIGQGAGGAFTAVNIGSHVAVMILGIPAVENGMHDHGMTLATMKMLADSCSLISGMISGTVHTAVNLALNVATDTVNTFKDICTGHDASASAEKLGKDLFVYATGFSYDSVAQLGEDVGKSMVDLYHGDAHALLGDAKELGMDTLNVIASNPYLQMAAGQLSAYNDKVVDLIGLKPGDALMIGFLI